VRLERDLGVEIRGQMLSRQQEHKSQNSSASDASHIEGSSSSSSAAATAPSSAALLTSATQKSVYSQLHSTQQMISQLLSNIHLIKEKALSSEQMVHQITSDIKTLDFAKRNLTRTITMLRRYYMLSEAIENLRGLVQKRGMLNKQTVQHGKGPSAALVSPSEENEKIAQLLAAINDLLHHFSPQSFQDVKKILEMHETTQLLKNSLEHQLENEFKLFFNEQIAQSAADTQPPSQSHQLALHHACDIANHLKHDVKQRIIQLYVQYNMKNYDKKFSHSNSGLDAIPKRYSWCKKQLRLYKMRFDQIFPDDWCVPQELVVEFCLQTRQHIQELLQEQKNTLDAQVLHKALLNTIKFERDMHSKFHLQTQWEMEQLIRHEQEEVDKMRQTLTNEPKTSESISIRWRMMQKEKKLRELQEDHEQHLQSTSAQHIGGGEEKRHVAVSKNYRFLQFISTCFEEYMDAYIEFEDKNMGKKVQLILERETWDPHDGNNSAQDLFIYISESLRNCRAFSQGKTLYVITQKLWKKHIQHYADMLIQRLPKLTTQNSSSFAKFNFLKEIMSSDNSSSASVLTHDQLLTVCHIIQMADYCQEELDQTQDVLYQVIDEQYRNQVTFSDEKGKFYKVLKSSIEVLVMSLMNSIDMHLHTMSKMPWGTYNSVGDQSDYVLQLTETLEEEFPRVATELPSQHFQFACDSFIITFTHAFQDYLSKCKKISNAGAQQLLLDVTHIKKFLKHLYEMHPRNEELFDEDDVASYVRKLNRQVARVEDILRNILLNIQPSQYDKKGATK